MAITCPRCGRTSHHPTDEKEGYCSNCRDWTTPKGGMPLPDPHADRALWTTDRVQFTLAILERALWEVPYGGNPAASLLSDLRKFTGDRAALMELEPAQWLPLLNDGYDAVQARVTRYGWGELRREPT